jgi:glyoxylase-like metal-dependent hydrolase (beta-lactamase superfamily II)
MVPDVFTEVDEQSVVYHQPLNEVQRLAALQALLACPTSSIGTVEKPQDVKVAQLSFPIPVEDNVYHCGYHSENSYGAASYFIERPEGNILVDSPRFTPPLVKRLEQMGGVRYMYLTHRDDVADHQKFAEHFQCQRILHEDDITSGTRNVEIPLSGTEPFEFAPDILILGVPGHTKGHTVLLYKKKFLFSGDHLAWSDSLKQLIAFRDYCWYSWPEQIKSMGELANYTFEWVLPGHGRRYHADVETMKKQMHNCVEWIGSVGR